MSIPGSLAALKSGEATGFVGYPQRYELGDGESKSFIHGVDQAGLAFMLELRIPERFIEEAKKKTDVSIPEVAALAETHRRARNPCYAADDNGPATPTGGAFLAEQVELVDASKNHYAAKWLSILREDESSPLHKIGFGYMEINGKLGNSLEIEEKKLRLIEMNAAYTQAMKDNPEAESIMGISVLEFAQERDQLALQLYELQQQWFIGVDVQYDRLEVLDLQNEVNAKQQVVNSISDNSVNGMYGGVILRPIKNENGVRTVIVDSVRQINHQYDYKSRCVPTVDTLWQTFVEKGGSGWMKAMRSKGYEIEMIPCQRVNCGKVSNEKYAKEMRKGFSKQLKAFVDTRFHHAPYVNFAQQNGYLACPVAMRNAETRKADFNGNILLSSIHAFGKAIGNVLELDKHGERTLKLSEIPSPKVKAAVKRTMDSPVYS